MQGGGRFGGRESAFDEIPLSVRDSHCLGTHAGDGKELWKTGGWGAGWWGRVSVPWDTEVTSFPRPSMERYGRVGARGRCVE